MPQRLNPHQFGCPILAQQGWKTRTQSGFVSGIDFSRAEKRAWNLGFSSCVFVVNLQLLVPTPQSARPWVPHPSFARVGKHHPKSALRAKTVHPERNQRHLQLLVPTRQSARTWVPHPSFARVGKHALGYHEPSLARIHEERANPRREQGPSGSRR